MQIPGDAQNIFKLKLRLPTGAEFEAEGSKDFILSEKERFLSLMSPRGGLESLPPMPPAATIAPDEIQEKPSQDLRLQPARGLETPPVLWDKLGQMKENFAILKSKPANIGANEAAILILAIAQKLAGAREYSALLLSKSMKKSGYFQGRIDRILANETKNNIVLPIGTKRNRAYQLTPAGLARAFNLAQKIIEAMP